MQYKIGTVTVVNGSAVVAGSGTLWASNITEGDLFTVASTGVPYFVGSVDSDIQITLSANYAGSNASGVTYALHRDFTADDIPLLSNNDIETGTVFSRAMARIQELLDINKSSTINDVGITTVFDNSIELKALSNVAFAGISTVVAISNIYEPFLESNWPLMMADKSWYDEDSVGNDAAYHGTVTTTERNALTPSNGDVCYNSTTSEFEKYLSSAWATTYRGVKREFPARAVAVAESGKVIIYDLTESEPVMWMVFNRGSSYSLHLSGTLSSLSMKGGMLFVGNEATSGGISIITFLNDESVFLYTAHYAYHGNLLGRNTAGTTGVSPPNLGISGSLVNRNVNDIATTQLDNAPVDEYGVKAVTWAVATDGGVSVGRTDGNVWEITGQGATVDFISFVEGLVACTYYWNNTCGFYEIPNSDIPYSDELFFYDAITASPSTESLFLIGDGGAVISSVSLDSSIASAAGLNLIKNNLEDPTKGMVNYLTTLYQSGWMHGDIKGAWLSDNDDTDAVGSELVTNGDFPTDLTGWSNGNSWWSVVSGRAYHANSSSANLLSQTFVTIVGKTYVVTVNVEVISGLMRVRHDGTVETTLEDISISAASNYSYTFVAQTTTDGISFYRQTSLEGYVDNVSIRLADADRSVNNNSLQVNGTITKTLLGGADSLVAYSGFSASNFLEQPYNADLDFGIGDFYIMGWLEVAATAATEYILHRGHWTGAAWSGSQIRLEIVSSTSILKFKITDDAFASSDEVDSLSAVDAGSYKFVTLVRNSDYFLMYLDGIFEASAPVSAANGSLSNLSATLRIGGQQEGSSPLTNGSLALLRMGAGAPTQEDIEYIYKQEKPLIMNGADAVLGGASDNITAIAWDDYVKQLKVQSGDYLTTLQGSTVVNKEASTSTVVSVSDNEVLKG